MALYATGPACKGAGNESSADRLESAGRRFRDLSDDELIKEYERSGLAIQDTYHLPSDEPIARALLPLTPSQQERVDAFRGTRRELIRRGVAVLPELIAFLRQEVPKRRQREPNAVAVPGFAADTMDLLVSIRGPQGADVFVDVLDGFGDRATTFHRTAALTALEGLTYVSFRKTKFGSNYGDAVEHEDAVEDSGAFRGRAATLYRNWLKGEGRDTTMWLSRARHRAKKILKCDDTEAIYCAAAFLRPNRGRDDQATQTIARLADVMRKFEKTEDRYYYAWNGRRVPVHIGTWMNLLAEYGALARPYSDILIRFQDELGLRNWEGFALLGRVGGERATAYLIKCLPLVEGTSLQCCRNALDGLAGEAFRDDEARIKWWKAR